MNWAITYRVNQLDHTQSNIPIFWRKRYTFKGRLSLNPADVLQE